MPTVCPSVQLIFCLCPLSSYSPCTPQWPCRSLCHPAPFPLYHIILSFSALSLNVVPTHPTRLSVFPKKPSPASISLLHNVWIRFLFCFCFFSLFICLLYDSLLHSFIPFIQKNISVATFSVSFSWDTDVCVQVSIVLFLPWHGKQCTLDRVTWEAGTSQAQEVWLHLLVGDSRVRGQLYWSTARVAGACIGDQMVDEPNSLAPPIPYFMKNTAVAEGAYCRVPESRVPSNTALPLWVPGR